MFEVCLAPSFFMDEEFFSMQELFLKIYFKIPIIHVWQPSENKFSLWEIQYHICYYVTKGQ